MRRIEFSKHESQRTSASGVQDKKNNLLKLILETTTLINIGEKDMGQEKGAMPTKLAPKTNKTTRLTLENCSLSFQKGMCPECAPNAQDQNTISSNTHQSKNVVEE